jgi:hypothetical protein
MIFAQHRVGRITCRGVIEYLVLVHLVNHRGRRGRKLLCGCSHQRLEEWFQHCENPYGEIVNDGLNSIQ